MAPAVLEQENKEIAKQYKELLKISYQTLSRADKKLIRTAFDTAVDAHKEQRRKSGEAYIFHPIAVAKIVASEIGLDATSIAAALLHDLVPERAALALSPPCEPSRQDIAVPLLFGLAARKRRQDRLGKHEPFGPRPSRSRVRSRVGRLPGVIPGIGARVQQHVRPELVELPLGSLQEPAAHKLPGVDRRLDRKSTRLNSSHSSVSRMPSSA